VAIIILEIHHYFNFDRQVYKSESAYQLS